jgi:hypothetical protein
MSEETVKLDILFGHIQLLEAPPRVEGNRLCPRGRSIEYDRYGKVVKDETYDLGHYLLDWEDCAHLFGVADPSPPSLWQRIRNFLK